MSNRADYLYIGMDIHKETHTAVLLNYMEEKQGEIVIENNIKGFKKLVTFIEKKRKQLIPIFGLEDVTHFGRNLAIYLLDKEYPVKEVNSALSYMERMSYATTKKNDTWDAQCICSVLIRRKDVLPDANPQDYYWTMKHLFNRRNALVKSTTGLVRQFHDQIQNNYPSYKKFFHEIECKTALAFYERFPSVACLESVTDKELGQFLSKPSHGVCSAKRAQEILDFVDKDKVKERDFQYARDGIIQSIVRQIQFNQNETKRIEKLQKKMLRELDYHLETLTGVSTVTASALVANIGDIQRFKHSDNLASYAGIAPIYQGSAGKGKNYQNKNLGNRGLYSVFYFLAIQQIYVNNKGKARNEYLRAYFEYKISTGKTKIQALICIMRKLVRIVYSMMKHKSKYVMPDLKKKRAS